MRWKLTILLLLLSGALAAASGKFYRYVEADGTVVIKSTITPERAALGYEVLDARGRLLDRIAPALTGDELVDYLRQKELQVQEQQLAKQREEYDISLLQRYSFVADIKAEKKRQLAQLNTRSAILRGNLSSFRSELEQTYEQVANFDRQNKPVPDNLKTRVGNLEEKISATEEMLVLQGKEVESLEREYQKAIERFTQLDELRGRRSGVK